MDGHVQGVDAAPLIPDGNTKQPQEHRYPVAPTSIKVAWGLGSCAESIMFQSLGSFSLLYYNQILGLSGTLCGLAVMVAMVFDAFVDPLVGEFSDQLVTPLGKRHPLMYAAILPCASGLYLFYQCPFDTELLMFIWMASFLVIIRCSVSFYSCPHLALGSEISPSYYDGHRTMRFTILSHVLTPGLSACNLYFIMNNKGGYSNGNLNPNNYPLMATLFAGFGVISMLAASLATQSYVKKLPRTHPIQTSDKCCGLVRRITSVGMIIFRTSKPLKLLFLASLVQSLAMGFMETNNSVISVRYWKKQPKIEALFPLAWPVTSLLVFFLSPLIVKRFDKKATILVSLGVHYFFFVFPFALRKIGLIGTAEHWDTIGVMLASYAMNGIIIGTLMPVTSSMWSDCVLELQTRTGERSNALVMSLRTMAMKLGSGISHAASGMVLDAIDFPSKHDVEVPPEKINQLILIILSVVIGIGISGMLIYAYYPMNVRSYKEIVSVLVKTGSAEDLDEAVIETARDLGESPSAAMHDLA